MVDDRMAIQVSWEAQKVAVEPFRCAQPRGSDVRRRMPPPRLSLHSAAVTSSLAAIEQEGNNERRDRTCAPPAWFWIVAVLGLLWELVRSLRCT